MLVSSINPIEFLAIAYAVISTKSAIHRAHFPIDAGMHVRPQLAGHHAAHHLALLHLLTLAYRGRSGHARMLLHLDAHRAGTATPPSR